MARGTCRSFWPVWRCDPACWGRTSVLVARIDALTGNRIVAPFLCGGCGVWARVSAPPVPRRRVHIVRPLGVTHIGSRLVRSWRFPQSRRRASGTRGASRRTRTSSTGTAASRSSTAASPCSPSRGACVAAENARAMIHREGAARRAGGTCAPCGVERATRAASGAIAVVLWSGLMTKSFRALTIAATTGVAVGRRTTRRRTTR